MNRHIAPVLLSRLKAWRSVALMGSRQVGKSHLLSQIVSAHPGKLLSFDDPLERQEAARDPVRYLEHRYKPGQISETLLNDYMAVVQPARKAAE